MDDVDYDFEQEIEVKDKINMAQVVPIRQLDEIIEITEKHIHQNPNNPKVLIHYDKPLSLMQTIEISKFLTKKFNYFILVLSNSKEAKETEFKTNEYCKGICKITATLADTKESYELFKSYYSSVFQAKRIVFVNEKQPAKWAYDRFNSFYFEKYSYIAAADGKKFILLSDKKLMIGEEYEVTGLLFDVNKNESSINVGKKQLIFLTSNVNSIVSEISQETLNKMKGKDMHWFIQSTTFPLHNTTHDFALLITLNTFHVWTGFPFNIIILGDPGTGKTKMLQKLAAVTGESVTGSAASTMKGFLPTFHQNNIDAGILATSRYKALVNEFFELISMIEWPSRSAYFAKLKDTLEGIETEFVSGLGRMKIRMKCDLVGVGQPPTRFGGKGKMYEDIIGMYEDFDPATLDRILFYTLGREQAEIIKNHSTEVDQVMAESGEDFLQIDYGDYLNPLEIRQILAFLKRVKFEVDWNYLRQADEEVYLNSPQGIFSRRIKFLLNMASAWAVIRGFSEGKIDNNTIKITINNEDIDKAKVFLTFLLNRYKGVENDKMKNRERLTVSEAKIYQIIENKWLYSKDKGAKAITFNELLSYAPKLELQRILGRLLSLKLIVTDGNDTFILYPDLSYEHEKLLYKIYNREPLTNEKEQELVKKLINYGLVVWDVSNNYYTIFDFSFLKDKFVEKDINMKEFEIVR